MLTNQVRELSRDLNELIRKHDGRDLTRAEIVRQLATEAAVLAQEVPQLAHLHQISALAVEIAVDHPQTVDMQGGDPPDQREALERYRRELLIARDFALDHIDERERIVSALLSEATVLLLNDDAPITARWRPAYELLKQAEDALQHAREEAAA